MRKCIELIVCVDEVMCLFIAYFVDFPDVILI